MIRKNRRYHQRILLSSIAGLIALLLSGCTATKFLDEGDTFYKGSKIAIVPQGKIRDKKEVNSKLETLVQPKPNKTFLGMRPGVWLYEIAGTPKKKKGLRHFIKYKLGTEPVLLNDAEPDQTAKALELQLNNDGYFKSNVQFDVKTKNKASRVFYTVLLEKPYKIRNVSYQFADSSIVKTIRSGDSKSLLQKGQKYNLEILRAEQERIEEVLENSGYYYFDDRYLLFKADTTVGNREVDLKLEMENGVPANATRPYVVDQIDIYPSYTLNNDSLEAKADTININGYRYIDNQDFFKPKIIANVINLEPDSLYRRIDHEYTLSHLMGLNTFKFVNIKYRKSKTDSSALHASIYMTPLLKKSFRVQLQGTSKTNNFVGPGLEFTFTNRNFLGGAEMFQLKLNTSYEVQIRNNQATALNAFEFNGEASLSVPRFVTPIRIRYGSAKYLPQTRWSIGYSMQQREQYFRLNTFSANSTYTWRETALKTHELSPLDVIYVKKGNTSPEFDALLESNPAFRSSFENQFIMGTRYSFTLNTQLNDDIELKYKYKPGRKSNFYFNGTADIAGNIPRLVQSILNSGDREEPYNVFKLAYSQYVRSHIDFRYYYQFDTHNKLATRLAAGAGYAFGNSDHLPYIKQFAVGGSNSLRGFPARSVGPGTYNFLAQDTTLFVDQRGDIKLEGNAEYRFDILRSLKGAVFLDAGNIWLIHDDSLRAGGQFNKKNFLKELAVSSGLGLRFDFNFFVLRFDLAFPLRKPYLPEGQRWVIDEINFRNRDWRRENLILNVAIGYPF